MYVSISQSIISIGLMVSSSPNFDTLRSIVNIAGGPFHVTGTV